jgi:hypothetical protein
MPRSPYRPRALQGQVFRGSLAISGGLLTPHQLRSSAWVRVRHDIYADSRLERDHRLECEATGLWLPRGAVIAGPSAAYLYGVEHAARFGDEVHVIAPPEQPSMGQRGIRVHHTQLAPGEIRATGGVRRTTPLRTAWDLTAWLGVVPAVSIIDGLLAAELVHPSALLELTRSRAGQRGCRQAARAFDLADGRAQSPPESVLRVRLVLSGLPRPVPQHPVVLPDGSVYHPDLSWPDYRVAVEYDGQWHDDPDQFHRDRRRLNRLVAAGWIILHVTSRRLHHEFHSILRETKDALRTRGWRG